MDVSNHSFMHFVRPPGVFFFFGGGWSGYFTGQKIPNIHLLTNDVPHLQCTQLYIILKNVKVHFAGVCEFSGY